MSQIQRVMVFLGILDVFICIFIGMSIQSIHESSRLWLFPIFNNQSGLERRQNVGYDHAAERPLLDPVFDNQSHIALIFDSKREQNAIGALNSLIATSKQENRQLPSLHLVTTASQQARIKSSWDFYKDFESRIHFYDFERCKTLAKEPQAFSPNIHISAHCKFYLQLILPDSIRSVLFVDNDIAFVHFPDRCMPDFKEGEMISMAPDMGDVCLREPQVCWPTGFLARVPPNLNCGNDSPKTSIPGNCPSPGQVVPYHFNGGVVFLNLEQMRKADFRSLYEEHIWRQFYNQGLKPAKWGEQCYINSFFSAYPRSLRQLPCSCNYQFTGVRRRVICPNQPVTIIHAWKYGLRSNDPYSSYIRHFMECKGNDCLKQVPQVRDVSVGSNIKTTEYFPFEAESDISSSKLRRSVFSIITRTVDRPIMIQAATSSVQSQVYQNFLHIIGIELGANDTDYTAPLPSQTVVVRLERSAPINPDEACQVCHSTRGKCLNAPPFSKPKERRQFLQCLCSLSFPGNGAFEVLHNHVAPDSYVIYLDDDNMLLQRSTLLKLANVIAMTPDSENKLFIAASHLGRVTPTAWAMSSKTISQGDIDASNLIFHASHISKTKWGRKRCGDWRTALSLQAALNTVWILHFKLVAANPFRDVAAGSQGGGMRQDGSKVSVIITSMTSHGFRAEWLYRTVSLLLSDQYVCVVGEVIFIWNNPTEDPPALPPKARILRMRENSLNNRWTAGLAAAKYNKILNLDDDIEVSLTGIMCMFHTLRSRPKAIVGPFARYFDPRGEYTMGEQQDYDRPYRMILPRILMAEKSTLMAYSNWAQFYPYVNSQEAHCDDVLLNMAVAHNKSEVIRVAFPAESIGDYWLSCKNEREVRSNGLAGQKGRSRLRTECIREFLKELPLPPTKSMVIQCANYGLVTGWSSKGYSPQTYGSSTYLPECSR